MGREIPPFSYFVGERKLMTHSFTVNPEQPIQSSPRAFPHFALVSFKSSSSICVVAGNSSIQ